MREYSLLKKVFVITSAAGVLIIGGLLIYGVIITPARQPYREALSQYERVSNLLAQTNVSLNANTATDEEFNKNIESVRAIITSLQKENQILAKQSVLETGDGKTYYDAYNKSLTTYIAFTLDNVSSIEKIQPVLRNCLPESNQTVQYAVAAEKMSHCATDMAAASDVPDVDYKDLAHAYQRTYQQQADIFTKLATLKDPSDADKVVASELMAQLDETTKSLSVASETFSQNLNAHRAAILNTDSAHNLKTYLTDKSRIF